jgi:hypothetical protein
MIRNLFSEVLLRFSISQMQFFIASFFNAMLSSKGVKERKGLHGEVGKVCTAHQRMAVIIAWAQKP